MSHAPTLSTGTESGPRRGARWWWYALAGLAYAALTIFSLPPFDLWFLAWVAPMPLGLAAILREPHAARMSLVAGLGTLPLWLYELTYISKMTGAGYVPLCVYLSLWPGLFSWLLATCCDRFPRVPIALAFPLLWMTAEILRCEVTLGGYPWFQAAQPLIEVPPVAAPARIGGLYLVSFLVVWQSGAIVDLIASRPSWKRAATFFAAGAAAFAILSMGSTPPSRGILHAAVVQTNLPQDNKRGWSIEERLRDMAAWSRMTLDAAKAEPRPDFIAWPETMFPGYFLDNDAVRTLRDEGINLPHRQADGTESRVYLADFASALLDLSLETKAPLLIGAIGVENLRYERGKGIDFDARFNSAFLVEEGHIAARYDKMALTPFGEYMPLVGRWKWLQNQLLALGGRGMTFDLRAGTQTTVFELAHEGGAVRIVTPICFETAWASQCHALVGGGGSRRADIMVCLTNDGWFADSDRGREQHLQMARWRCLELGTPMVRAANTGISAAIDAKGNVLARGVDHNERDTDVAGILTVSVPIPGGETTYLRHGDVFRWGALGVGGALAAGTLSAGLASWARRTRADSAAGARRS